MKDKGLEVEQVVDYDNEKIVKRGMLGFLLGLAVIIPGVSGSTIAIIFKLYHKILHSIANLFKNFKHSFMFLLPIIIGAIFGVILGLISIQKLIDLIPFAIVSLFGGLMLGALPSLKKEIPDEPWHKRNLILTFVGALVPVLLSIFSIFFSSSNEGFKNLDINILSIIIYIFLGFIVAGTQFIPGGSATAILMALGYFVPLMQSIHLQYIKDNPMILIVYGCLFFGFILGCIFFSKSISFFIDKYKKKIYFIFIGLSIGSVLSLFLNLNMVEIYISWFETGFPIVDISLGCGLCICGLFFSLSIISYNKSKKEKNHEI